MNALRINLGANQLRLIGLGLIGCARLAYSFSPISVWRYARGRGEVWSGDALLPYRDILVVQCVGPWFVLMFFAIIAGSILLLFGKPLSRALARLPEMTAAEKLGILNAAAVTVGLYALLLTAYCVAIEYQHGMLDAYRGFRPLLRYANRVAVIALILFLFTKGVRSRWFLFISGIVLLFWAL
jgi:hypothetical protein